MSKMNIFRLILTAVLSLIIMAASAQPRSEASAEAIAQKFLEQSQKASMTPQMAKVQDAEIVQFARSRGANPQQTANGFYVYNDESNGGYVVVSGDERQIEVLGYSNDETFDPENIPCGLRVMLEQYSQEYEWLQEHGDSYKDTEAYDMPEKVFSRGTRTAIGPLMRTMWGQSPYYNNECPTDPTTNKKCITGCVATAMAQIMTYYCYPSVGQGQNSYTSNSRKIKQSMDFSKVKFDWGNLYTGYDDSSTKASVNAVAALMHACGVSVNMDYRSSSSSAKTANVPYAMTHYFKYDRSARYYDRNYHTGEEWEQIIQEELAAGRPILYAGRSYPDSNGNTSGHAFVLDGMDDAGYYHFNWGWSGSEDNYFRLSSLTPGSHVYTNGQRMVCHISPNKAGDHEDPWYANKFEFNPNKLEITLNNVYCYSTDATSEIAGFSGFIGWELKNADTGKSSYGYNEISDFKTSIGFPQYHMSVNSKLLAEGGSYLLYPIILDKSKTRTTYIRTQGGETDYYLLQVKNGKIQVTVKGDPKPAATTPMVDIISVTCDNTNLTNMTKNDVLILHGTYKNTGKTGEVETRLRIWDEDMNPITTSKTITKSFPKNSETTVDFKYSLQDLPEGNYIATAQYYKTEDKPGWTYMKNMLISFSVTAVQPTAPNLIPVGYSSDNLNLDNLSHNDILTIRTTYKNTGKTDNVKTRLRIWDEDMEPVALSDVQTVSFKQDAETTVKYDFKLTDLPEGKYIATMLYQESWTDNKWHYYNSLLVDFIVKDAQHPEIFWISVDCDNQNLESISPNEKLVFHGTVGNNGSTGDCRTLIMVWNDETGKKYVSDPVTKTFKKDQETTFDLEYTLNNVPPGEYTATVLYEKYWIEGPNNWNYSPSMAKTITVVEAAVPELVYVSVSCDSWLPDLMSQAEDLELQATFNNKGQTADVKTRIRIWDENTNPVTASEGETMHFKGGEETTVKMKMPLAELPKGKYIATIQYYDYWNKNSWMFNNNHLVVFEIVTDLVGIEGVRPDEEADLPVFDLNGRRLNKARKGLNIIGGKIIYVK